LRVAHLVAAHRLENKGISSRPKGWGSTD
jgi:hypothetical protein